MLRPHTDALSNGLSCESAEEVVTVRIGRVADLMLIQRGVNLRETTRVDFSRPAKPVRAGVRIALEEKRPASRLLRLGGKFEGELTSSVEDE